MRSLGIGLVFALGFLSAAHAAEPGATNWIGIDPANPFYFQYDGRPVLLLGGSSGPPDSLNDEGMFLWPDPIGSLDKLKAAGGNLVRCLMSGRLRQRGEPLWPFEGTGMRYNLDAWNEVLAVIPEIPLGDKSAWDRLRNRNLGHVRLRPATLDEESVQSDQ
jgi:hypothetical protein